MLTSTHIQTVLKAVGAGSGLVMTEDEIAKAFNDAMLVYGENQFTTVESVAALLSTCMMESAYFRTTEEYAKDGPYAPFIGRTFGQLTWKTNYELFGTWCFKYGMVPTPDYFVIDPTRLADLKWAALGGVWYFTQVMFQGKPLTAYSGNVDQVAKAVNMGNPYSVYIPNGIDARRAAYKVVLTLGDIIIPKAPVVVKPPSPEPKPPSKEKVLYSSKWKCNYVKWRGVWMHPTTVAKLLAIPSNVIMTQGGLSFAPASSMTHAGFGAGDINTDYMNRDQVWQLCKELWQVDIIPCPRGFNADSFQGRTISNTNDGNEHIHFLDVDCLSYMHPEAQAQVHEVLAGGDGLLGNKAFYGPSRTNRRKWATSKWNPAVIAKKELELPSAKEVTEDVWGRDGLIENVFTSNVKNTHVSPATALVYLGKEAKAAKLREEKLTAKVDELSDNVADLNKTLTALLSKFPSEPAS
jgi:hypothetical protein